MVQFRLHLHSTLPVLGGSFGMGWYDRPTKLLLLPLLLIRSGVEEQTRRGREGERGGERGRESVCV